jgi:hypothetical protein
MSAGQGVKEVKGMGCYLRFLGSRLVLAFQVGCYGHAFYLF